jgi:ribonuclease HI
MTMSKSDQVQEKIIIFTDGSCDHKDRVGGIGVVMSYKGHTKEIYEGYEDTTISRMELQACIVALQALKTNEIPAEIYSDSAYVVNCFKELWYVNWRSNGWKNAKKKPVENQDLWIELLDLYEKHGNVELCKIKGHSGSAENDRADVLANMGRRLILDKEKT